MQLEKMTQADYDAYMDSAISTYAAELLQSGRFATSSESRDFAVGEYQDIFKQGMDTPDIYLYNIIVDEKKVGVIWLINEDKQGFPGEAFIGDFLVYEPYRRQGYGRQALLLTEEYVKQMGLREIRLGVLLHNTQAKRLYERVGYTLFKQREFDCVMQKIL